MKRILLIIIVVVSFTACKDDTTNDKLVTIKTSLGDMTVLLYDETPKHKANFLELAESGDYDSTLFHRVIEDFMIQGGDIYLNKETQEPESGRIDPEIMDELFHKKGALAAARQGDRVNPKKKSSGCQFYIVQGRTWSKLELTTDQFKLNAAISELIKKEGFDSLKQQFVALQQAGQFKEMSDLALKYKDLAEQELNIKLSREVSDERLKAYTTDGGVPHLDGDYTVFGRVVEGMDVIDKIASVAKQPGDRPIEDIYTFMEIKEIPKSEITKKYGYQYPEEK